MPFALIVIGLIMIVTGSKDTYAQFGKQVAGDFTGPGNFTYWLASLGVVGAIGYIRQLQQVSHIFLALIIIVMVLSNGNPNATGGGFFQKIQDFLKTGPTAPTPQNVQAANSPADNAASTLSTVVKAAPFVF